MTKNQPNIPFTKLYLWKFAENQSEKLAASSIHLLLKTSAKLGSHTQLESSYEPPLSWGHPRNGA